MQEAEVKEESNTTAVLKSGKRQVKPVDLDPHGEKLLQVLVTFPLKCLVLWSCWQSCLWGFLLYSFEVVVSLLKLSFIYTV